MSLEPNRYADREERNRRYITALIAAGRQEMARQELRQQQEQHQHRDGGQDRTERSNRRSDR